MWASRFLFWGSYEPLFQHTIHQQEQVTMNNNINNELSIIYI
jgi:hypothetical protein